MKWTIPGNVQSFPGNSSLPLIPTLNSSLTFIKAMSTCVHSSAVGTCLPDIISFANVSRCSLVSYNTKKIFDSGKCSHGPRQATEYSPIYTSFWGTAVHGWNRVLQKSAVHGQVWWLWSVWAKEHYVIIKKYIGYWYQLQKMFKPNVCTYNSNTTPTRLNALYTFYLFPSFFPFISSVALFSKRRFYILKNSIILMQINTKLPTSIYPSIAL